MELTKIQFKTKNPKQLQAAQYWIDNETDELLYGGAKGGGKSYLGAALIFGDALIYPETQYFIARQELIDLRKFTVPTINEVFKNWHIDIEAYAKFDGNLNAFSLYNGSKVFLISCRENPSDPLFERFGSMQMTRGWIEEGGEVAEAAKANLWLSIGRWKNEQYKLKSKLLITANPKKGWMKREFVEPARQNSLPSNKKYIQAFATDNAYLPKEYVRKLGEEKDTVRKQRLFEGNWDYDEDQNALVSFDALTDAFSNTITKDGEKYLIVDVARKGKDSTTFSFWDGLECYRIEKYQKQSTAKTEQQVKDFGAAERIPYSNIMIDEDGIGGGVVDHLFGVRGFTANSTPIPTANEIRLRQAKLDNFLIPKRKPVNLKTQCGYKLAELINEHKASFKVPEYREVIIEELSAILREKDIYSEGKLQLRPKVDVKEDLGRSPDVGDTLLMRAWFELSKIAVQGDPVEEKSVIIAQANHFAETKERMSQNSSK